MQTMNYKDYTATIEYSKEDDCYVGQQSTILSVPKSLSIYVPVMTPKSWMVRTKVDRHVAVGDHENMAGLCW